MFRIYTDKMTVTQELQELKVKTQSLKQNYHDALVRAGQEQAAKPFLNNSLSLGQALLKIFQGEGYTGMDDFIIEAANTPTILLKTQLQVMLDYYNESMETYKHLTKGGNRNSVDDINKFETIGIMTAIFDKKISQGDKVTHFAINPITLLKI